MRSGNEPDDGLAAAKLYRVVEAVKRTIEVELRLKQSARELVPRSKLVSDDETTRSALEELEQVLQHHLAEPTGARLECQTNNLSAIGRQGWSNCGKATGIYDSHAWQSCGEPV